MSIEVRFQIHRGDFCLNAEFLVPAQGITAILGPSGCGKTTLLRAVAGLECDPEGYCRVGEEIWQQGVEQLPVHRRPLGYVFQEPSLFPHLDVRANLEYGLKRTPQAQRRIAFNEAVSLLGVELLLQRRPDNLSGGERQRVAIARALLTSPRLLLMDEPLAALDWQSKQEILPYLERLPHELGIPVLYVSHSTDEVARLADQLILMERGRVLASGPVADMLVRTDLPLAQGEDAEVIINAEVRDHDDDYQLTGLAFDGGEFFVARKVAAIGATVRLRVLARDVSLVLQPPVDSSILNCLHTQVVDMTPCSASQQLVQLRAGEVTLLARITRKSADQLGIKPGMMVYAQVKSVALLS